MNSINIVDITQENGEVNQSLSSVIQSPESPVGDEESEITQYKLLTRAELLALDESEPKWKRIRIATLVLFWILLLALMVALIVLIVLSPKCPPIPEQQFWQKKVGYWVDVFGFKDSNEDFIGDLQGLFFFDGIFYFILGLIDGQSYIKENLGAEYVILDVISNGQFTNNQTKLGLVKQFDSVDGALGSLTTLKTVVKAFHKIGMEVVLSLDINSVSLKSDMAKSKYLKVAIPNTVTRAGLTSTLNIQNNTYYTVGDTEMVDLNLESKDVMNKIKSTQNKWFIDYPTGQIFSPKSVEVVAAIKTYFNENPRISGKPRLLAVDPGDTGYGIEDEDMALMFLNASGKAAADIVISRQFVRNRGWKTIPSNTEWIQSNFTNYMLATGKVKELIGLTTGTTSDRASSSVYALAMVLLLPGSPIIYYGNELGNKVKVTTSPLNHIYPHGKVSFPNLNNEDTTLPCHLPFPWSNTGAGFSKASNALSALFGDYIYSHEIKETVDMVTAAGRGSSPFTLVKKLIELRKEPSIQWGKLEMYKKDIGTGRSSMEVFIRKAEGFPAIVVAINNPSITSTTIQPGVTLDIKGICPRAAIAFAYPSYENFNKDEEIKDQTVYLPITTEPAVYILNCLE